jgi:hypothetical protein
MIAELAVVTIQVKDQDEALRFYTEKLGFCKRVDFRGAGLPLVNRIAN